MEGAKRSFILLLAAFLAGLALFGKGFFLTRLELRRTSGPADLAGSFLGVSTPHALEHGQREDLRAAWSYHGPRFSRAALVIIDAWRYDFAAWRNDSDSLACASHASSIGTAAGGGTAGSVPARCFFTNRMPLLADLLQSSPDHARLYRAVADAPTVTMQRLKGITSGSLPTFIDAASNFETGGSGVGVMGGVAITEDTIVGQMSSKEWAWGAAGKAGDAAACANATLHGRCTSGRPLAFLGDDTWASLFPWSFNVSFPFPSFNVADLHTVDAGIDSHVGAVIRNSSSWSLLVAHYLGVDHVGHTHGPAHPNMASKLSQLDSSLHALLRLIAHADAQQGESSLLVILGDHGMTSSGNHGGASLEEAEAALVLVDVQGASMQESAMVGNGVEQRRVSHTEADDRIAAHTSSLFQSRDSIIESATEKGIPKHYRAAHVDFDENEQSCGSGEHLIINADNDAIDAARLSASSVSRDSAAVGHQCISQIDIVPTVSLLLGLPIPFASLGKVLADVQYERPVLSGRGKEMDRGDRNLLLEGVHQKLSLVHAHAVNAWQMNRYLHAYNGAAAAAAAGSQPLPADSATRSNGVFPASTLSTLHTSYRNGMRRYKRALCALGDLSLRKDSDEDTVSTPTGSAGHDSKTPHLRAATVHGPVPVSAYERASLALSQLSSAPHGEHMSSTLYAESVAPALLELDAAMLELGLFISSSSDMCRSLWTQFNVPLMIWGIVSMIAALFVMGTLMLALPTSAPSESRMLVSAVHSAMGTVRIWVLACVCVQPIRSAVLVMSVVRSASCSLAAVLSPLDALCTSSQENLRVAQEWASSASLYGLLGGVAPLTEAVTGGLLAAAPGNQTMGGFYAALEGFSQVLTCPPQAVISLVAASSFYSSVSGTLHCPAAKESSRRRVIQVSGGGFPWAQLGIALCVLRLWALTTNSFIVAEARVVGWLLQASTMVAAAWAVHTRWASNSQPAPTTTWSLLAVAVASLVCTRLTEQSLGPLAFPVAFGDPMGPLPTPDDAAGIARGKAASGLSVLAVVASLCIPVALWFYERLLSRAVGPRARLRLAACVIGHAACLCHWANGRHFHVEGHAHELLRLTFPRAVYCLAFLGCGEALAAHLLASRASLPATPTSSSLAAALSPSLALLLGPNSPPVLLACVVHAACLCVITAALNQAHAAPSSTRTPVDRQLPLLLPQAMAAACSSPRVLTALMWGLLPAHYYLATGHGNVFSSLDFSAPFVGFDHYHAARSGTLMLLNTYAAHVLAITAMGAGLLVDDSPGGGGTPQLPRLLQLVFLPCCVALVSSCFCLFARRHLMVWAVFAPKWVFDAAAVAVTSACVLVAAAWVGAATERRASESGGAALKRKAG